MNETAAEARWTRVADGVHVLPIQPEGHNVALIVGEEAAALVNCGANAEQGEGIRRRIAEVTALPLTHVLVTDGAAANCGGLDAFADLVTIGHASLVEDPDSPDPTDEPGTAQTTGTAQATGTPGAPGVSSPAPNSLLHAARSVDLGGLWLEAVHLGPGRSEGDVAVVVPAAEVVIAGDLVDGREDEPEVAGQPTTWADAVHALVGVTRPGDQVVPGRGQPMSRDEVNIFGATVDQLLHAEDPAAPGQETSPADAGDRPRLPLL